MYKICHTEESTRRQRRLEQGLLDALQTLPYERITLTGLCRQMQISRKSFYRYFPSKEDCLLALMDHTLADCNTAALAVWEGDRELKQVHLERFFLYWQGQKAFLDAVRENSLSYLLMERTTVIVDAMKQNDCQTSFARDQVEYFVAYGLMASVLRWHQYGFQSSPEEMARIFSQVLHAPEVSITRLIL